MPKPTWVAAAIAVFFAVLLAAVLITFSVGFGKKVYTREEFRKEFMGAGPAKVRLNLGTPDEILETPMTGRCWLYKGRTKDADGTVDNRVSLCFHDDRVYVISPVKKP